MCASTFGQGRRVVLEIVPKSSEGSCFHDPVLGATCFCISALGITWTTTSTSKTTLIHCAQFQSHSPIPRTSQSASIPIPNTPFTSHNPLQSSLSPYPLPSFPTDYPHPVLRPHSMPA